MVISIIMVKYYLYQFQTLKVISLFDLIPVCSKELISELIKNEKIRAQCETKCSLLAIKMMINAKEYQNIEALTKDAIKFNTSD